MFFFLKNVSLLILYFSTNNSIIITKREIRNFYRNFHLLPQFHRNKHLKNTATFTATCWKSPREISNFRPQLSQKRPAKSWGDWTLFKSGIESLVLSAFVCSLSRPCLHHISCTVDREQIPLAGGQS